MKTYQSISAKLKFLTIAAALAALGPLLGGCASVEDRIEKNPEKFMALSPEEQQRVQSGRIESGYTKDMVFLSKGEPSEKTSYRERGKLIEVWTYNRPVAVSPGGTAGPTGYQGAFTYPTFGPTTSAPAPMFYGSTPIRVEFEDGRVRRLLGDQ